MRALVVALLLLSSTCCLRGQQAVLRSRQVIITDHANTVDGQMLLLRNISAADRIQPGVDANDRGETIWLSSADQTTVEAGGETILTVGRAAQITMRTDWNSSGAFNRLFARAYPGAGNTGRGLILGGVVYGGSLASPAASLSGSTAFEFRGGGYDGSAERTDQGSMLIRLPATWSGTSAPTEILFRTTAVSSLSERDVFLLESTGNVALKVGGATLAFPNASNSDIGYLSGVSVSTDGDIQFEGDGTGAAFIPAHEDEFSLGLATMRWLNVYGSNGRFNVIRDPTDTIPVQIKSFVPLNHAADDIGSGITDRYDDVFATDLFLGQSSTAAGTTCWYNASNTGCSGLRGAAVTTFSDVEFFFDDVSAATYPAVDNEYDFGLSTRRWQTVYGITGRFNTLRDTTDSAAIEIKSISPITSGTDDIGGGTTDRFDDVFATDVVLGQNSSATGTICFHHSGETGCSGFRGANVSTFNDVEVFFDDLSSAMYPAADNEYDLGLSTRRWQTGFFSVLTIGGAACDIAAVTGAPTGGCTTCDMRLRTDGGSGTTLYICEAGAWAAK